MLLCASSAAIVVASRALRATSATAARRQWRVRIALFVAMPLLVAAFGVELVAQIRSGLLPTQSSYGAVVYTFAALQSQYVIVALIMAGYTLARSWRALLDATRRATFDNTMLLWHYTVAQGLVALLLVHGFPRMLS